MHSQSDEIARLFSEGWITREIAVWLGLSELEVSKRRYTPAPPEPEVRIFDNGFAMAIHA